MNANETPSDEVKRFKTLQAIHDEAVDAIIAIDEHGMVDSVNPAAELLFGYSAEELIGTNIKILMPNPYHDEHDGYLKNYLKTGNRKIIGIGREVVGQRSNGSTFPIHLAVSEINVGNQRLFAGVIRDLTDYKQLEAQQTALGRIVEDSLNEVFIFDAESLGFVQANRGARDNLGYSIEELRTMTPVDIKPDFSPLSFRKMLAPLQNGESESLEFETIHERKDGTTYEVEVHLQKSLFADRPVFVAIILDITSRREAERELEKQREATQAKLENLVELRTAELRQTQEELLQSEKFSTLGKVSGGIAHEIRNPLNAVKTSAYYLLNSENPSAEKIREHLERIDRQVTLIDNVVTALSDVARMPAANLKPFDLEPILRTAVSTTNLPGNVSVEFRLPEQLPTVMVDENQILIAIKNLVRNARDAMPEGGTLTIEADVSDEEVVFSICDTGEGIAAEHLEKILEPLFTTKARGMGLGLSITRAIADKNDCRLQIESELGVGSKFGFGLKRNLGGSTEGA